MDKNSHEFKQKVYDLVSGSIDVKKHPSPESEIVVNEFAEGSPCEEAYREVYQACGRLSEKLGVDFGEDADVECILNKMFEIQEILCMKMYDYGWLFAKKEEEE